MEPPDPGAPSKSTRKGDEKQLEAPDEDIESYVLNAGDSSRSRGESSRASSTGRRGPIPNACSNVEDEEEWVVVVVVERGVAYDEKSR